MSAVQNNQTSWTTLADQQLDPKYEKCRNITEEIYKRINITFQIKKLESGDQSDISDNSDQIDSNELSNETDLFACDKSDISSSTGAERAPPPPAVNNNNNEERTKAAAYRRPRKRFRKRVKKRSVRVRSDSEGSSDEAPLARALLILPELKPKPAEKERYVIKKSSANNLTLRELLKPDDIKVPTVIIEKIKSIDNEALKKNEAADPKNAPLRATDKTGNVIDKDEVESVKETIEKRKSMAVLSTSEERKKYSRDLRVTDWKSCDLCNLSFRGERGLRRHMTMSHIVSSETNK